MKILCIVQARMGSERLPEKVMRKINGIPMIAYTLERIKRSKYVNEVVLATSVRDTENKMVEYLNERGYNVFRGDENNVLKRYRDAEKAFGGDIIIRITGDCPLIDSIIIDQVITYYLANDYDYVRLDVPETFIRGFDVEIFSKAAMERVYEIVSNTDEATPFKEHVTLYMYKHPEAFKIGYFKGSELYRKGYRLCVDTKEDFELVTKIYEHFNDMFVSAKAVVKYLDDNAEIAKINKDISQKHV